MESMLVTHGYGSVTTQSIATGGFGPYVPQTIASYAQDPSLLAEYPEYQEALEAGFYNKNILMLLGDFWSERFAEYETLKSLSSGVVTLLSSEYRKVLELVLSSNIADIPVINKKSFGLTVFKYSDAERVYLFGSLQSIRFALPAGQIGPDFLTNSLFSPSVILKQGVHYSVADGYIDFYVDIFDDTGITKQAYFASDATDKYILFWASDIALSEEHIYHRFGKFLYQREFNSSSYKAIVKALQMFFTDTKTLKNIRRVFNVLFGLPMSTYSGEVVTDIEEFSIGDDLYTRITTDRAGYLVSAHADMLVSVGDVLPKGTLLADMHDINDYITDPEWHERSVFPWNLVEGYTPIGSVPGDMTSLLAIKDDPNPDQEYLYQVLDKVMRFNLIKAMLRLTYDNYEQYRTVRSTYSAIATGMPDYLYILYEVIFLVDLLDEYADVEEEDLLSIALRGIVDDFPYVSYDPETGEPFDPESVIIYDGGIKYDGTYKYMGFPKPDPWESPGVYDAELQIEEDVDMLQGTYVYDGSITYDGSSKYGENYEAAEVVDLSVLDSNGDPLADPFTTIWIEYGSALKIVLPGSAVTQTMAQFLVPVKLSAFCGSNGYDATDFLTEITYDKRFRMAALTAAGHRCRVFIDPTPWGSEAFMRIEVPMAVAGVPVTTYLLYNSLTIDDRSMILDTDVPGSPVIWEGIQPLITNSITIVAEDGDGVPILDGEGNLTIIEPGMIPYSFFSYTELSGPNPTVYQFTDKSAGNVARWNWDFGDGSTSAEQNPTHEFDNPDDVVNVSLFVYSDFKLSDPINLT